MQMHAHVLVGAELSGLAMQVGKSFAKGLDDAMGKCISNGGTATSCCSVVKQVTFSI